MKKFFSLFAMLLTVGAFTVSAETKILCTTLPMTVFTNAVVKGVPDTKVTQMLASAIGCPHDYALTPQDMRKLAAADVIVMNGLGMEDFLAGAVSRVNRKAFLIDSSKNVKGVLETCGGHEEHEGHDHGGHHHAKNEHLFAGPETAAAVVENIAAELAKKYPANASKYRANAAAYAARLHKIALEYAAFGKTIPVSKRLVAVQHGIFDYLAAAAGLKVAEYLQAHTGSEPSAAQVRDLIRDMKAQKVALIIAEKNYPARVTELVSKETGIPVLTLAVYPANHSADPAEYLEVFEHNLKALKAFYKK